MSKDDSLRDLIERVEAAEGPDRELDCLIWGSQEGRSLEWQGNLLVEKIEGPIGWIDPGEHQRNFGCNRADQGCNGIRAYTRSMDAVLTLMDPADEWELSTIYNIARATVGLNRDHQTAWPGYGEHKAGNPVLALLSATLRAHMGTGG